MLPDVSEYILPKIKKTNQVKALMLGSTRFHNTVLPHIIVNKEALNIHTLPSMKQAVMER